MDGMSVVHRRFIYTRGGKIFVFQMSLRNAWFLIFIYISAMVDSALHPHWRTLGPFFSFPTWWREREGPFVRCGVAQVD